MVSWIIFYDFWQRDDGSKVWASDRLGYLSHSSPSSAPSLGNLQISLDLSRFPDSGPSSNPLVPDCLVPPSPTGGWAWQSNSTKGHYTLMYIVLLCYVYYTRTGVLKSIDVDIEFFETMILDFTIIIITLTTDLIFVTNITNYIC